MIPYSRGLHELGDGLFAYLQPDGSWGWSNAGLIVDSGASLLVDTLFDLRLTEAMLKTMRGLLPAGRVDVLVNTHSNGDHWFGNQLVPTARIIATLACVEEMIESPPGHLAALTSAVAGGGLGPTGDFLRDIFGPFEFGPIEPRLPDQTFESQLELTIGTRKVQLIDLGPAHTASDVVAHVPSARTVFTGDILFIGGHPVMWAGPVENWIAALDRLLSLEADTFVPGHGPVTDRSGVGRLRAYWEHLVKESRERYEAGIDPLQAARDMPLGGFADWGDRERLAVNVAAIYRGLSGQVERPTRDEQFAWMAELRAALSGSRAAGSAGS